MQEGKEDCSQQPANRLDGQVTWRQKGKFLLTEIDDVDVSTHSWCDDTPICEPDGACRVLRLHVYGCVQGNPGPLRGLYICAQDFKLLYADSRCAFTPALIGGLGAKHISNAANGAILKTEKWWHNVNVCGLLILASSRSRQ